MSSSSSEGHSYKPLGTVPAHPPADSASKGQRQVWEVEEIGESMKRSSLLPPPDLGGAALGGNGGKSYHFDEEKRKGSTEQYRPRRGGGEQQESGLYRLMENRQPLKDVPLTTKLVESTSEFVEGVVIVGFQQNFKRGPVRARIKVSNGELIISPCGDAGFGDLYAKLDLVVGWAMKNSGEDIFAEIVFSTKQTMMERVSIKMSWEGQNIFSGDKTLLGKKQEMNPQRLKQLEQDMFIPDKPKEGLKQETQKTYDRKERSTIKSWERKKQGRLDTLLNGIPKTTTVRGDDDDDFEQVPHKQESHKQDIEISQNTKKENTKKENEKKESKKSAAVKKSVEKKTQTTIMPVKKSQAPAKNEAEIIEPDLEANGRELAYHSQWRPPQGRANKASVARNEQKNEKKNIKHMGDGEKRSDNEVRGGEEEEKEPVELELSSEGHFSSRPQCTSKFDLSAIFAEYTKMENESTGINRLICDLAVMNQQYEKLLDHIKTNHHEVSITISGLKEKLLSEVQALDITEKNIQVGSNELGKRRDEHRANLVEIAKKLKEENDSFELRTEEKRLFYFESKMLLLVEEIKRMKQTATFSGGHPVLAGTSKISPSPDERNTDIPWVNELRNEEAVIRKEIEIVSAAVLKLTNMMRALSEKMPPKIEGVLYQAQALISESKEAIPEFERVNVENIVPDIEKQVELHEQRQKIQVFQDDLKNTKDKIRKEEIKMVEANHSQDQVDSTNTINDIRTKLNHLKTHRDELVESIMELCNDHDDPSICRFPDLMPVVAQGNSDTATSKSPSKIRVSKPMRIKPRYYTLREQLGEGGFAQVFKVEYQKPGQEMEIQAFKKFSGMQLGDGEASVVADEIETLAALDHPNIIKLLGVSDDPNSRDGNDALLGIGMMMEYCENGSLRKYLDHTPQPNMNVVIRILVDVTEGMQYLHQHKPNAVIHRDLKSDNILLDKNMNAKICDFGIAKIIEAATTARGRTKDAGTAQYKAPESYDGVFEPCSDVYSFGCVIFEILNGKRPWDGLSDMQIMKNILKEAQLDFSVIRQDAPPSLVELMKRCLDYDKKQRPSFAQIKTELNKLIPQVVFINVDPSSDEFDAIENQFFPDGNEGSLSRDKFKIVEITKVHHKPTEGLYEAEKINIKQEMKCDDANERLMFHGTKKVDPLEIVKHRHGLMRDCSGMGFYGKGIYFAELARYSHEYRHTTVNGQFKMLVCSVICGNAIEMGQRVDGETQKMRQRKLPIDKHSVIAGPHRPKKRKQGDDDSRMVVIYKDTQCTPKYIITYEENRKKMRME